MAEALAELGDRRAFVVHGHDGLDEVSTTGPTDVWEVTPAGVQKHLWTPADFGVKRATLQDLAGGDPTANARIIERILAGQAGAPRDIVLVNAAAGLIAANLADSLAPACARPWPWPREPLIPARPLPSSSSSENSSRFREPLFRHPARIWMSEEGRRLTQPPAAPARVGELLGPVAQRAVSYRRCRAYACSIGGPRKPSRC